MNFSEKGSVGVRLAASFFEVDTLIEWAFALPRCVLAPFLVMAQSVLDSDLQPFRIPRSLKEQSGP